MGEDVQGHMQTLGHIRTSESVDFGVCGVLEPCAVQTEGQLC